MFPIYILTSFGYYEDRTEVLGVFATEQDCRDEIKREKARGSKDTYSILKVEGFGQFPQDI